jgi:multidrug resistance protein MdtO
VAALVFVDDPLVRFQWVILAFFVMFFALSALSDYVAAARFGYLLIITTPLWDQHISAELRVEGTLWAVLTVGAASIVTLLLELAFAEFSPGDEVIRFIAERLESVEVLLGSYAADRQVDETTAKTITRLVMVGTSRQRRILDRSIYSPQYHEQMGAVVALVGRLIDLAANLEYVGVALNDNDRNRVRDLAGILATFAPPY